MEIGRAARKQVKVEILGVNTSTQKRFYRFTFRFAFGYSIEGIRIPKKKEVAASFFI